jgi:hypothetical protein
MYFIINIQDVKEYIKIDLCIWLRQIPVTRPHCSCDTLAGVEQLL